MLNINFDFSLLLFTLFLIDKAALIDRMINLLNRYFLQLLFKCEINLTPHASLKGRVLTYLFVLSDESAIWLLFAVLKFFKPLLKFSLKS